MSEHIQGRINASINKHSDTIVCHKCGAHGSIAWEDVPSVDGQRLEMIGITGEFYERLAKKPPYPIELVCNTCGAAQPGAAVQS